jgi:DNA-binding transcriptional ArsR family regulator
VSDRPALPSEAEARAAIAYLLERASDDGTRPSAGALAAQLGISRPALYRHYRPLVDELRSAAGSREETRRRRLRDRDGEIVKLRQEKEDLRCHVRLYEEIIRQLTVENDRLKWQLESQAGVTRIASPRPD